MSFVHRGLSLSETRLADNGMCKNMSGDLLILSITSIKYTCV